MKGEKCGKTEHVISWVEGGKKYIQCEDCGYSKVEEAK